MGRGQVKRKLVTGGIALLLLVGGAVEAEAVGTPPSGSGWIEVLWDDLGRALGWLDRAVERSESEPPKPPAPVPTADSNPMGSYEEPPTGQPEMGPEINPDG